MKAFDVDKARSEEPRTLSEFLKLYNENLPSFLAPATVALLEEFKRTHGNFFKSAGGAWTLDLHRKRVMDWLRRPL